MISQKYKLYPTKEQKDKLEIALDSCRRTYNILLSQLTEYRFTKNELQNFILDIKSLHPEIKKGVYSKTLQHECYNLFSNLASLKELKKNGRKIGKLRYKGKGWKKTFTYNQSGFKILKKTKRNTLRLSKIGEIKMIFHRKIEGKIKQIIIKKEIDNWYAIIQTDAIIKLKCGKKEIGIDMSPSNFGVTSENEKLCMPESIDLQYSKIKKLHRKLSKKKKGSKNRLKAKIKLQKEYWRNNNQKVDFYHKLSYKLVTECKIIGIEDLSIKGMMMGYYNAKNFQKIGWSTFITKYLIYKAESAGCQVWKCDRFEPTTQKCSKCGNKQKMELKDRIYNCSSCGFVIDRDLNASINIKKTCRLGTNLCEVDTSLDSNKNLKVSSMKQEKRLICS